MPVAELAARMAATPGATAILWLRRDPLAALEQALPAGRIYLSSTLLERDLDNPLVSAPGPVFVVHPFRLPGKSDPALLRFKLWARTRGIASRGFRPRRSLPVSPRKTRSPTCVATSCGTMYSTRLITPRDSLPLFRSIHGPR